jgi:hypothetical protein
MKKSQEQKEKKSKQKKNGTKVKRSKVNAHLKKQLDAIPDDISEKDVIGLDAPVPGFNNPHNEPNEKQLIWDYWHGK